MTAKPTSPSDAACLNTDKELWREREGDYYADSLFVTAEGGIGINCGGHVIVRTLKEWHKLATPAAPKADPTAPPYYSGSAGISAAHTPPLSVTPAPAADAGLREALEICHGGMLYVASISLGEPLRALNEYIEVAGKALSAAPQEQPTRRTAEDNEDTMGCAGCGKRVKPEMMFEHEGEYGCKECFEQCVKSDAKADAERAAAVPDGWQLVPKEPTEKMLQEAQGCGFDYEIEPGVTVSHPPSAGVLWKEMLAASPQPPVGEG